MATKVPMPPADGAPFHCDLMVDKPRPIFTDSCGNVAVECYVDPPLTNGYKRHYMRCEEHKGMIDGD